MPEMRRVAFVVLCACARPPAADPVELGWTVWQPGAWQTWAPSERVFAGTPVAPPRFRTPRPFRNGDVIETEQLPVMFDVLFDPHAAAHVHAYGLDRRATLAALRELPAFPSDAVTVKLAWYPVHAHGLTALPVWDGAAARPDGNPDHTWQRAVAIDPSGARVGQVVDVEIAGRMLPARVVALAEFVHHALTDAELPSARAASRDATLARGDFVALVAAHVSTKQRPDWTWTTFWWQDGYQMDATLGADAPCFNPWLEARFPDGTHSNCLACHRRAVVGATEFLPVTQQRPLAGSVATDFVWSLVFEAR